MSFIKKIASIYILTCTRDTRALRVQVKAKLFLNSMGLRIAHLFAQSTTNFFLILSLLCSCNAAICVNKALNNYLMANGVETQITYVLIEVLTA